MNCTGERCFMQFGKVDPKTCKCVSYCPQATPPKTNADYIRAMSDEELAMWINNITTNALSILALGSNKQTKSIFHWLDWLKQEYENNKQN